jgi:hypothetical protein
MKQHLRVETPCVREAIEQMSEIEGIYELYEEKAGYDSLMNYKAARKVYAVTGWRDVVNYEEWQKELNQMEFGTPLWVKVFCGVVASFLIGALILASFFGN